MEHKTQSPRGFQRLVAALTLSGLLVTPVAAFGFGIWAPEQRPRPTPPPAAPPETPQAPAEPPRPPTTPVPPTPTPAPVPVPPPPSTGLDLFRDVADPVGTSVDRAYSRTGLMSLRPAVSLAAADSCHQELRNQDRFSDRIAFFVNEMMKDQRPEIGSIASLFGASSNVSTHRAVSLKAYPMCNVTAETLAHTISAAKVPSAAVISKLNQFADAYNRHREGALQGKAASELALNKLWTRFMGCLSYAESLTTADTSTSQRVATKVAPSDYRKPAGVKFYEDPLQPEASRLNIGLFQFTPTSGGNVHSCLRSWNALYPRCAVPTSTSQAEMIRLLGSGYQTFNAFCGTHKLLQTFAIQVNTTKTSATHPGNLSGGKTIASANRCVTPFFRSGWAYNHFGPLQNSTGSNMDAVLSCVLRDLP